MAEPLPPALVTSQRLGQSLGSSVLLGEAPLNFLLASSEHHGTLAGLWGAGNRVLNTELGVLREVGRHSDTPSCFKAVCDRGTGRGGTQCDEPLTASIGKAGASGVHGARGGCGAGAGLGVFQPPWPVMPGWALLYAPRSPPHPCSSRPPVSQGSLQSLSGGETGWCPAHRRATALCWEPGLGLLPASCTSRCLNSLWFYAKYESTPFISKNLTLLAEASLKSPQVQWVSGGRRRSAPAVPHLRAEPGLLVYSPAVLHTLHTSCLLRQIPRGQQSVSGA